MNANRIVDMIVRQVMRRLVNKGIDKGFDMASRMGGSSDSGDTQPKGKPGPDQSQSIKQAKQMTRQVRRFMRF